MSPQLHPAGFRINDKPIAASFAHPFSFQPLGEHALRDDTCIASSSGIGGGDGFWVKYWDEGTSVAEMTFEVEEPEPEITGPVKLKKKKDPRGIVLTMPAEVWYFNRCTASDDQVSSFLGSVSREIKSAEAVASTLPVSDKPVTLSLTKSSSSIAKPNPAVTGWFVPNPMIVAKAILGRPVGVLALGGPDDPLEGEDANAGSQVQEDIKGN
jgi:RNA-binding protein 5/10